eukprot:PhF_6_TR561/c1_g1_i1/m.546/K10357/MYO5; myosin V
MATITEGSNCFVYHPTHAWIPGTVMGWDPKACIGTAQCTSPKEVLSKLKEDHLFVCDAEVMEEDVNDLLNLTVLHDSTLLTCLKLRYAKDIVYTNIGAIVVAFNPFNFKIPWYMDDKMKDYLAEGDTIDKNLPHSWAVAHNTYYEMRNDRQNQCILVSGESGAGKTEASKIVMKYLGAVSALRGTNAEKEAGLAVGDKMMQSNPILEAFGNAKTVRNDNSSRFGKFMKIKFSNNGFLTGADITKYLLEKSRIITAANNERVYHSFYDVLKGKDRQKYGLQELKAYKTVNSGKCTDVAGMDDADDYRICCEAMSRVGIESEDISSLWQTVAGILVFQNSEFLPMDEGSKMDEKNEALVRDVAKMWKVEGDLLVKELLTTTIVVNKQATVKVLNVVKAIDSRDSLSKAVYDYLFSWLVEKINKTIDTPDSCNWIGLLDIFGFEDFEKNSFEQLCINLTNETLQGHYNKHIFEKDMEECRAEGINVSSVAFPDNTACIMLMSAKQGILSLLDEECSVGKGSDHGFLDKISQTFSGKNPFFEKKPLMKTGFNIHHYAGTVTYEVENFLEKNRDTLKDAFKIIMGKSTDPFVAHLLPPPDEGSTTKYTVGGFFKNQLGKLMDLINETNPHWIRCVKPHPAKKPRMFDGVSTLKQLGSSGVLGTVKIRKAGFPIRLQFNDFSRRYKIIARGLSCDFSDPVSVSGAILKAAGFTDLEGQQGKTKVFLKTHAYQRLEVIKKEKLQTFASVLVQVAHTRLARNRGACFYRNFKVACIQAFARKKMSQHMMREKEYEANKEQLIAFVKRLLELNTVEEKTRKELYQVEQDELAEIKVSMAQGFKDLEAAWWRDKPARDEKIQLKVLTGEAEARKVIYKEEEEGHRRFLLLVEESMTEAIEKQIEREEWERTEEERRIRAERERKRRELEEKLLQERLAAQARKEEQRRIAIYYWNKKQEEKRAAKVAKETEQAEKRKWIDDAVNNAQQLQTLLRSDAQNDRSSSSRFRPDTTPGVFSVPGTLHELEHEHLHKEYLTEVAPDMLPATPKGILPTSSSPSSAPRRTPPGTAIGNWSPKHTVADYKDKLSQSRMIPDKSGTLDMVQQLKNLKNVKSALLFQTPRMGVNDARNPVNPRSPDWQPPDQNTVVLPDGTELHMSEVSLPKEEIERQRLAEVRARRKTTVVDKRKDPNANVK